MKSLAELNIQQLLKNQAHNARTSQFEMQPAQKITVDPLQNNLLEENQETIKTISLSFGTFIDHVSLSLLVSEKKIIKTWPTQNWTLLFVDQTERFVIFEADDSWLMAILDLKTGLWHEDTQGHMLYFSDDGEAIIDNFHSIIHPFPNAA